MASERDHTLDRSSCKSIERFSGGEEAISTSRITLMNRELTQEDTSGCFGKSR